MNYQGHEKLRLFSVMSFHSSVLSALCPCGGVLCQWGDFAELSKVNLWLYILIHLSVELSVSEEFEMNRVRLVFNLS